MISIITPAYIDTIEKLEWLNEMIASVQAQSWEAWELVLMDDASPITITLQNPDGRIRQLRMVNRSGPALCRNTAVAVASFDCLLPVDADDLLANSEVLYTLYETWNRNRSKFVYGDLQRIQRNPSGQWQPGKIISLTDYTFEKSLDLEGIVTVSCMHSIECHVKAGGWKPELEAGLEDVEYWIAAGKAGFCGQKIGGFTNLIYRRHEGGRSHHLRMVNRRENEMRNLIREMHSDVYEGKYPMACCGGGSKSYTPPVQASQIAMASSLNQFSNELKVWVEYAGQREGSFGLVGQFTGINYNINGQGHKLEVHINDLPKFKHSGRGQDFRIGVAPPNGQAKPEQPARSNEGHEFVAPEPQLGQILMLDR